MCPPLFRACSSDHAIALLCGDADWQTLLSLRTSLRVSRSLAHKYTAHTLLILRTSQLTSGWILAPDDQVVSPLEMSPEPVSAALQVGDVINIDATLT